MCNFKGVLKGEHEIYFLYICVSDKHAKTSFDEVHLLADGKRRLTVNVVLFEKRINPNKHRCLTWIGSCIKWFRMKLEFYQFHQCFYLKKYEYGKQQVWQLSSSCPFNTAAVSNNCFFFFCGHTGISSQFFFHHLFSLRCGKTFFFLFV